MPIDFALPPDVEEVRMKVRKFMDSEVRPVSEGLQREEADRRPAVVGAQHQLHSGIRAIKAPRGVEPWCELPLWVGEGADPTDAGFMQISSARAIAEGLVFRPVEEIVRDTLEWDRAHPEFRSAAALAP